MTERELTPSERARATEVAAVIEADVRVSLQGKPYSAATVKQAAFESALTIIPPATPPIVEADAADPTRVNVFVPLEWFTAINRKS